MPNRSGKPVTIIASGGKPVTNVPGARPATPVPSGGEPITLIPSGGMPMSLINADGSAWSDTPAVPVIGSVVISGTGKIGTVHTAVVSATSSLQPSYAYQWRRSGVSIPTATAQTYTPTADDDLATLTVTASVTNSQGTSGGMTSAGRNITYPLALITHAGIIDRAQIGLASTVVGFACTGAGVVTYSWQANGSQVGIGVAWTPTEAVHGMALVRRTTVTNSGGPVFADTPALTVVDQAPVAASALPDEVFDQSTGVQTIATAEDFTVLCEADRSGVTYSLVSPPAGVTIDGASGIVSVSTAAILSALVVVRATNSGGFADSVFGITVETAEVEPTPSPDAPRSLDSRVAWTGHSMVDDKFVSGADGVYINEPLAKAIQTLGGVPHYDNETGPYGSAWNRYDNSGTFGKDPVVSLMQADFYDVFVGTEAHGGEKAEWWNSVQEHILFSQGLQYAELWHQLAVDAGCEAIFYQNLHCGTWSKLGQAAFETPGQWRARQDTEVPRWQQIPDYVNARRAEGTPPLQIIPLLELMMRVYDEIQEGTLNGVTMDDFFSDYVHLSALGQWMSQALCYACIYRRNPADFPIVSEYVSTNFTANMLPRPTAAVCDQLKTIIWDVVTRDPRTGVAAGITDGLLMQNTHFPVDWSREHIFLNHVKTARPWGVLNASGGSGGDATAFNAGLDADGYPTVMPAATSAQIGMLTEQLAADASHLSGRYRFEWTGAGTFVATGLANQTTGSGWIEGDYVAGGDAVRVRITSTAASPNHARAFKFFHTKHAALVAAGKVLNPDYLVAIGKPKVLRFMNLQQTNLTTTSYPVTTLASRAGPEHYTYQSKGAPIEALVAVANESGVHPWICVPTRADDAFVAQMATYVRDNLDPRLKCYVEYSNEVWNTGFEQYQWIRSQAIARWGQQQAQEWAGMRSAQVMNIWTSAFSGQMSRIVRVAGGCQTDYKGYQDPFLDSPPWVSEGNAAPHTRHDALAITGYFNFPSDQMQTLAGRLGTETQAQTISWIDGIVAPLAQSTLIDDLWPYWRGVANTRAKDLIMYEGGTHIVRFASTTNNAGVDAMLQAYNYSPEVANVYRALLTAWDTFGDDGFHNFEALARPSSFGSWGAKRWMMDTQPRWAVLDAYNKGQALPVAPLRPAQVTGLMATAGDAQVSLAWQPPANNGAVIIDYVIERNVGGGSWATIADGASAATSYVDTGRTNGTAIQYRVAAVNSAGTGDASAPASAKP